MARRPNFEPVFDVVSEKIAKAAVDASKKLTEMGIPHAFIGALAVGAYGHPRATKDVDLLLAEEGVAQADPLVVFKPGTPLRAHGVPVDYLVPEDDFLNQAVHEAVKVNGLPVVRIGPLIHLKLRARRRQDLADVEALVLAGIDIEEVRRCLDEHGTHEMREDFEGIVRDTAPR